MMQPQRKGKGEEARRGAARAERERKSLRERRYAQRLEREGRAPARPASTPTAPTYEAEVVPGLERFAREELRKTLGARLSVRPGPQAGTIAFAHRGDARALADLGTVTAVYRVLRFDVPRPRALLGEEHLQSLLRLIQGVISLNPEGSFRSFRFSAAGVTSSVFARLSEELERRTGLRLDSESGDLLIRVRRRTPEVQGQENRDPVDGATGRRGDGEIGGTDSRPPRSPLSPARPVAFEVLVRLTPRPLSARAWRVRDLPGALNATVARAMALMTGPTAHDRYVNLTCGSGTLMVERLALGPARLVVGGDRDWETLRCAEANLQAAGYGRRAVLARWDAGRLPLGDASVNVLCADLPYGMLMGNRRENERLYPELIAEATRVAAPGAAMVLITHAVRVLDQALMPYRTHWNTEQRFAVEIPFRSGVLRPQIVLLRRSGRRGRAGR
jgi:tRNA (guanine6-N2)-methyltransferase